MVSCGFANICGGVLNSAQCEQPVFLQAGVPAPPYLCRFRPVGKGLERETLLPFPRLRGSGTHYETGPGFLLLFSIKSKEERLCFAVKVLNWRTSHLHQPPMIFLYLLRCPLRQILHRVQQLPIPINAIMQMRPCGKSRIPRFCHHLSLLDFLPLFHQYLRKVCI